MAGGNSAYNAGVSFGETMRKKQPAIRAGASRGARGASGPIASLAGAGMAAFGDFIRGLAGQPSAPEQVAQVQAQEAAPTQSMRGANQSPLGPAGDVRPAEMTFESLVSGVAKANGGKISLNQMGRLADVIAKTTPARNRPPSAKDVAGMEAASLARQMYEVKVAQARQIGDRDAELDATLEYQGAMERLAGIGAYDQMVAAARAQGE